MTSVQGGFRVAVLLVLVAPSVTVTGSRSAKENSMSLTCEVTSTTFRDKTALFCNDSSLQTNHALCDLDQSMAVLNFPSCHPDEPDELQALNIPTNCTLTQVTGSGKKLVCSGASLGEVLSTIRSLGEDVSEIDISDCGDTPLVELNQTFFENNVNLLTLFIQHCGIEKIIKGAFKGPKNLQKIGLNNNHIWSIDEGTFRDLRRVNWLSLAYQASDYEFKLSPYLLREMTSLARLNMGHFRNMINWGGLRPEYMEIFFSDQEVSLQALTIFETEFSNDQLPFLKNLKNLQWLDFRYNLLGHLEAGSLPKLAKDAHVDLRWNKIMHIDPAALSRDKIGGRPQVFLSYNSYYCDCNLLGFIDLARHNRSGMVLRMDSEKCMGPRSEYGKRVMSFHRPWWECSAYVPLIAVLSVTGLLVVVAILVLVIFCNRVNIKHWLLERRVVAKEAKEEQQAATERSPLVASGPRLTGISSLPKGLTDAYILYNMDEKDVKKWVDDYIQKKLFEHPTRVTLQWAAGPKFIPLWKQVKEYGLGVKHFLLVVTEDLLQNHWPLIAEKGGVEYLSKFVLVLWGLKKKDVPKVLLDLRCPCLEWPTKKPKLTNLQRERELFWKSVRLAVKDR